MSSGSNHRRGHGRITDNGPTWEGGPPCSGCNSTHVARSRKGYKQRHHRKRRRASRDELQGDVDLETVRVEPPRDSHYRPMNNNPFAVKAYRRSMGWDDVD